MIALFTRPVESATLDRYRYLVGIGITEDVAQKLASRYRSELLALQVFTAAGVVAGFVVGVVVRSVRA